MQQALQVFVTVVERRNFSRAAEQLHMTQPAVSQYIKLLEEHYQAKLLDRTNKYVYLTKAGEVVYHHAKEILSLYAKIHHVIEDLTTTVKGPISIGASYTFGEYVLPYIIAEMQGQYPEIQPNIVINNTKEIMRLVAEHQLDVGIIEGQDKKAGMMIEAFAEDQMVVVAAQHDQLAESTFVKSKTLEDARWIVREVGSGTREATEHLFSSLSISPRQLMEFGSTQIIKESVEAGLGISLLSRLAIRKELAMGVLKIVQVKGTPYKRKFSIVLGTSFQTKAVQQFIELVKGTDGLKMSSK